MTGDIREELARFIAWPDATDEEWDLWLDSVRKHPDSATASAHLRALDKADAILASPLLDRVRREAAADALEEAAREVPTGMFVVNARGWLLSRAAELRAGDVTSGVTWPPVKEKERGGRSLEIDLGERHHPECDCPDCRPWC